MKRWNLSCLLLLAICLFRCVGVQTTTPVMIEPEQRLAEEILSILDSPDTQNGFWGVYIKRLGEDKPLLTVNEARSFMPASNMKLYSTAATLHLLGKDFNYEPFIEEGEMIRIDTRTGEYVERVKS